VIFNRNFRAPDFARGFDDCRHRSIGHQQRRHAAILIVCGKDRSW
jgi:hypothetical protein